MLKVAIFVLLATTYGQQTFKGFGSTWGQSNAGTGGKGGTGYAGVTRGYQGTRYPVIIVPSSSTLAPGINTDPQNVTCTTESGIVGRCVRYYYCGGNIISHFKNRRDRSCPSFFDTCCPVPNDLPVVKPVTLAPPISDQGRQGCGWRNPNGLMNRTAGDVDNEAKFGEFPWMVAVLEQEPLSQKESVGIKVNTYVQGGSLIHPNVVLTAARSLTDQSRLRVRVGEWDTQTNNEIYPHQDRDVTKVVTHENFNKGTLINDVALLFLSDPVDMSQPHIGLACLPPQGDRAIAGTRCLASGWGKNLFGKEGRYQVILKRVEVPVVDRWVCQTQLRKTRLGPYYQLHSSFMCAGGEAGKDVCRGDGGSPLVCPTQYEKDRYVQNGIVSWGIGCGDDGVPGVYVDVASLRSWIDDKVAGHGYDPKTYTY